MDPRFRGQNLGLHGFVASKWVSWPKSGVGFAVSRTESGVSWAEAAWGFQVATFAFFGASFRRFASLRHFVVLSFRRLLVEDGQTQLDF